MNDPCDFSDDPQSYYDCNDRIFYYFMSTISIATKTISYKTFIQPYAFFFFKIKKQIETLLSEFSYDVVNEMQCPS